jgi:hypothetical protein
MTRGHQILWNLALKTALAAKGVVSVSVSVLVLEPWP